MKSDVDKNEVDQLSNVVHPYYLLNLAPPPNNSVYSVSFIPESPSLSFPFHHHKIYILYIMATIFDRFLQYLHLYYFSTIIF